jgi:hypothetical protein
MYEHRIAFRLAGGGALEMVTAGKPCCYNYLIKVLSCALSLRLVSD